MSIFKELKDRKLTASDKLIFLFLSENKNSTYVEICQQLELSINTVKAGLKKLKECNLIERKKEGRKRGTKIVPCQSDENSIWYKICTIFTSNYYNGTKFVPYYNTDTFSLNSNSYVMTWYKNCTMLWELERKETKERHIYINNYIISININIINKEGKSSLTSFASTSLKYYIGKFNFVNDPDHKELNSVHNSLIPTKTEKTDLAEIVKAPAKRKRAKAQFNPPTAEQVEEYMKQYVEKKSSKFPKLLTLDLLILSEKFVNKYSPDWKEVKNWENESITWLLNEIKWNKERQTPYQQIQDKKDQQRQLLEDIFAEGRRLEEEANQNKQQVLESTGTENSNGTIDLDFWGKEI